MGMKRGGGSKAPSGIKSPVGTQKGPMQGGRKTSSR